MATMRQPFGYSFDDPSTEAQDYCSRCLQGQNTLKDKAGAARAKQAPAPQQIGSSGWQNPGMTGPTFSRPAFPGVPGAQGLPPLLTEGGPGTHNPLIRKLGNTTLEHPASP